MIHLSLIQARYESKNSVYCDVNPAMNLSLA